MYYINNTLTSRVDISKYNCLKASDPQLKMREVYNWSSSTETELFSTLMMGIVQIDDHYIDEFYKVRTCAKEQMKTHLVDGLYCFI